MESNSVCKHTRDKQSRTTANGSPICLITSMITVRIVSCYQLIITVTISEKMNAFFCSGLRNPDSLTWGETSRQPRMGEFWSITGALYPGFFGGGVGGGGGGNWVNF